MKKICLAFFTLSLFSLILAVTTTPAQVTVHSFKVLSQHSDYVDVEFTLPQYKVENEVIENITYQHYSIESGTTSIEPGMPEFPIFSTMIAVPYKGNVRLEVLSQKSTFISNQVPYPCQYQLETQQSPKTFLKDTEYYQTGSQYPTKTINISNPQVIRDFRVVSLMVSPFSYNAKNRDVQVQETMTMRIHFLPGQGENEMTPPIQYSRSFENIYQSMILNYENMRDTTTPLQPRTVLIIYPNSNDTNYMTALNNFAAWKAQKGFEIHLASTTQTGTTNTSIKTYIQNAYNTWENKPDFIILIGDVSGTYSIATWNESFSGNNAEGDYPYTHLSGGTGDYLGDAFIGRISISNIGDFQTILAKIYAYEKTPTLTNTAWYNHLLLVGDTTHSGISTIYTNKYIKEISFAHNPSYTYSELYEGNFSSLMTSALNQGSALFNYRGYINMSTWDPSTANLVNGNKLTHAIIITCATGNFGSSYDTATTEDFIRLGTASSLKGAITATGMCTSSTHTMLNNTLAGGIFDGIYSYDMHTMGEAILNGKLYLSKVFGVSNTVLCNTFAHWCNLMGDPTVEVYTKIPDTFNVTYPTSIPVGTNYLDVTVSNIDGIPVQNACVTLYQTTNLALAGYTDAQGKFSFQLPQTLTGTIILTTSKDNFAPDIHNIALNATGSLAFDSAAITDNNTGSSSGNGNGIAEAGETIDLLVHVKNSMDDLNVTVAGILTSNDPYVTISSSTSPFGQIQAGSSNVNEVPFTFHILQTMPDLHQARFEIALLDSQQHNYTVVFPVVFRNGNLQSQTITIADEANGILDPGETVSLLPMLHNSGSVSLTGISAVLHSLNSLVTVNDSLAYYGDIPAGDNVTCNLNSFNISARLQLVPGMIIPFELRLSNAEGYTQRANFNVPIGHVTLNDPLGPDEYGYLIYDMGDTSYPDCPQYNWIGIAPSEGGSGTLLALNDTGQGSSGSEGDATGAITTIGVNLPFSFSFYGQLYPNITVCSNGFIGMGTSSDGEFRNYRLPGALGPNPMIAAFWDDLQIPSSGGVYTYYDASQHYFVIEWYHAVNGCNELGVEETFQIILYDQSFYPTSLGDGQIKLQYKVVNNIDVGSSDYPPTFGNYATVGIKDFTGKRGLEYTFNNQYPTAAKTLNNLSALLITGPPIFHQEPHLLLNEMVIHDVDHNQVVEPGETIELGLRLTNMGESTASNINATLSTTDPYVTMINANSSYDPIAGETMGINRTYFEFQVASTCPNDHIITFTVDITANGNNWQRYTNVRVSKPQLVFLETYINDLLNGGNGNGKADPNENLKLILNISNPSLVDANNVNVSLTCTNSQIVIADSTFNDFTIPVQKTIQKAFDVYLPENLVPNTYLTFNYVINAQNALPVTGNFTVGVSTTGLSLDFEANNGGFISSAGWTWGIPTPLNAHSGTHLWATGLSGSNYPDMAHYELTSTPINIGENASLTFWHHFGFELNYDGGNVKVSTNNGQSFSLVTPTGGYTITSVSALSEPGFSGELSTWTQVTIPLSSYSNQQIIVKWTMGSDISLESVGWFIDDVQITGFITSTSMIAGQIEFPPSITSITDAIVSAGAFDVHPNPNGQYAMYLRNNTYPVSIYMPFCQTIPTQNVTLSPTNQMYDLNFNLNYLVGPTITGNIVNNLVHLNWNTPETTNTIQYYSLHRQRNADIFHTFAETPDSTFADSLTMNGQYLYYVTVHYAEGESAPSNLIQINAQDVGTNDHIVSVPVTKLFNNYPNPFNPDTHIAFSLNNAANVSLKIFNIRGQLVKTLADGKYNTGYHDLIWNGKNDQNKPVSSGVYFYRIVTPGYTDVKKAILLK